MLQINKVFYIFKYAEVKNIGYTQESNIVPDSCGAGLVYLIT